MLRTIPVHRDCLHCGHVEFTAAISVIVVWAHCLRLAIPMSPDDELRVCRAFDVHPETQQTVGSWLRALIVFEDGNRVELRNGMAETLAYA